MDAEMRREVWKTVADCVRHNPAALRAALLITTLYIHFGPFARYAAAALDRKIAEAHGAPPSAVVIAATG